MSVDAAQAMVRKIILPATAGKLGMINGRRNLLLRAIRR